MCKDWLKVNGGKGNPLDGNGGKSIVKDMSKRYSQSVVN